jgi:hypothetical protein
MSIYTDAKRSVKRARWTARRKSAAKRYGEGALATAPIVIGNAMPKSGSHLLYQILLGLTKIGPFVDPGMPPLTRSANNTNLDEAQTHARIAELQAGDIAYGYFKVTKKLVNRLTKKGIASVFVSRDPRDVLVSHVFYATDLYPGHGMHAYYKALPDMESRINAAIEGVQQEPYQLSSIRMKYEKYIDWTRTKGVLSLRFEDLILKREISLGRLLDFLQTQGFSSKLTRDEEIEKLKKAVEPKRSGTFRGGRVGDWRDHFTKNNIENFKKQTGDLVLQLGYEKDTNWS